MDRVTPRSLLTAVWVVALVATCGSLFLSLGLGLIPCRLCWYQRILMYPLVVVLGVAVVDRDHAVWRTALPLSALGTVVAAYHVVLQLYPSLESGCSIGGGCAVVRYSMLDGLLTIPRLSLTAFVLITLGLLALRTNLQSVPTIERSSSPGRSD